MQNKININIRTANSDDASAIADIYLASRRSFIEPYAPLAHSESEVRNWVADHLIHTARIWVAESDRGLLGFIALMTEGEFDWIEHLYLLPSAVGNGIGSRLIALAKIETCRPIRLYTFQANGGSRRFYESHGFGIIARSDGHTNEESCPDLLYEWQR